MKKVISIVSLLFASFTASAAEVNTDRSLKALTAALNSTKVKAEIEQTKAMSFITDIVVHAARDEMGGRIIFRFAHGVTVNDVCTVEANLTSKNYISDDLVKEHGYELSNGYYIIDVYNSCRKVKK